MSSSSPSLRDTWGGSMSRSKSRRSAPTKLPSATATTTTTTTTAANTTSTTTLRGKAKTTNTQTPAIQRFSQYGARFNARVKKTGAAMAAPVRSPRSLSANGFFSTGGSSASAGGGVDASVNGGDGGDDSYVSRTGSGVRGVRYAIRERNRERKGKDPMPSSPPLAGPAALAATINDTLTLTTGRAAGESISTSDSSMTNGSLSGGGSCGTGGGSGGGGSPAHSETWPWQPPETPPPACMPNLHQSSGSEGTSGSENDEGFGSGPGGVAGLDYQGFLSRRSNAASRARALRSAPGGGGTLRVPSSCSSPRPTNGSAAGSGPPVPARTGKTAGGPSTAAGAALSPPSPHPQVSLPPRVPRSVSSGLTGVSPVQPSSAPPLVSRRLSGAAAPVPARSPPRVVLPSAPPVAARSPPRVRAASLSALKTGRGKAPKGAAAEEEEEEEERHHFFRDPRLEATLGLIRSGQPFCQERHIVVDFVKRAKPTTSGSGKAEVQPTADLLRHALLLTDAALYLLEVEMLPTPLPQSQSPTDPESWAPVTAAPAAVGSTRHQPPGSGEAVAEKPKVKSIKMMDRLMPSELLRVSLPFREMTLRNGDVVAKRGCGIVLHTKVGGRVGNLWLKCRTNQDRGALVDALVPWSETSSPGKTELNVQQLPESSLAMELAPVEAARVNDVARPKDTDCVIS